MRKSVLVGITVFSVILLLTQYITYQRYLIRKEAERQAVLHELQSVKDRIALVIGHSTAAVKTLALIISKYGVPAQFDSVAHDILKLAPYIDALQFTNQGVITHIYPLAGHEAAIGFDILKDSIRRHDAIRDIESRSFSLVGPYELKQGGRGLVGRLPIFINNKFRGFALGVIRTSTLLKAIGVDDVNQDGFRYQLSKYSSVNQQEEFFLNQSYGTYQGEMATAHLTDWGFKITVIANKRQRINFNITFALVGLILSVTGGVLAWHVTGQPEKLKRLVDEKTAEIIDSRNQYRNMLDRVSDGFISYDREWRYRYINAAAERLLELNAKALIGKNVWEEFPELKHQPIYDAYHQAVEEQRYVHIESYLPDKDKWFVNHLYPAANGLSVFFKDITQQKRIHEEIQRAHQEKEAVLQRVSDSIISLDKEWRYTFLNDAAFNSHPPGRQDVLGKVIWDVHPEVYGTVFWNKCHEAFDTKKMVTVESYYAPMEKWYSARLYPSEDGLTIFYQDVTEIKNAEGIVAQKEKRFRALIENSTDGLTVINADGIVVEMSPSGRKILGYNETEIIGKNRPDLIHTDDQDKVMGAFQEIIANPKNTKLLEYRHKMPDGSYKWLECTFYNLLAEPHVNAIVLNYRDITERKKAENQLKRTNEQLTEAQLVANIGSWETDLATLDVSWSSQTYSIFELDPATFRPTHQTFLDYVHADDRESVDRAFTESFHRNESCSIEHRIITHTGQVKWVEERWRVYKNEKQEPYRASGTCQDITKRKEAEKELLEYTEEIKQLTAHLEHVREEERTRIAREVHDELGQQLTGLKIDASWLTKSIGKEQTAIHKKLSEMLTLMDHTISTIRRISSDLRPGILDDLGLVAALEWQSTEFEKKYEIACVFKSEVGDLEAERRLATAVFRIYQEALTNIVRHAQATAVESIFLQTSTHLILTVRDNGLGFNTKEVKSKRTLGFIGMRERALMVGAELSIKSEKGTGTMVTLEIPLTLLRPH